MKPFDLDAALKGKPVCTRDGRDVKIAGYNPDARDTQQLLAWYPDRSCGKTLSMSFYADGRYGNSLFRKDTEFDLFMKSEKKEGWTVFIKEGGSWVCPFSSFTNKDKADKIAASYPKEIKTMVVKLEWEE